MDPYRFLEDFERRTNQVQEQLEQSQEALAGARSEATSPDGAVSVTVAGGGSIESLKLSPNAMRQGHDELGRAIIETIRTAQAQAARAVQESMRPLLGDGEAMSFLTEQVEAGIAQRNAAGEAPSSPRRSGVEDIELDDDFDDWEPRGGRR